MPRSGRRSSSSALHGQRRRSTGRRLLRGIALIARLLPVELSADGRKLARKNERPAPNPLVIREIKSCTRSNRNDKDKTQLSLSPSLRSSQPPLPSVPPFAELLLILYDRYDILFASNVAYWPVRREILLPPSVRISPPSAPPSKKKFAPYV